MNKRLKKILALLLTAAMVFGSSVTVSYTHLDVYKRQVPNRPCPPIPSGRHRPWNTPIPM